MGREKAVTTPQDNKEKSGKDFSDILCFGIFGLFLICLSPWFPHYISQTVHSDIAYLTSASQRLLTLEKMSEAYFDTNPPLSIILSSPAVILAQLTDFELYHAIKIYHLALLTFFGILTALALKTIPTLNTPQKTILLMVYITTGTVFIGYDFGQRDHLLGLALFPLILIQYQITYNIKINTIMKWVILLFGSIFILLKPHFGLVPLYIFIHRLMIQKKLLIIFDHDAITLLATALSYIALLFTLFPDFVTIIFPDVVNLYMNEQNTAARSTVLINATIYAAILLVFHIVAKPKNPLLTMMCILSIIGFIPAAIQAKGWMYHSAPAYTLLFCAMALLWYEIVKNLSQKDQVAPLRLTPFLITSAVLFYVIFTYPYTENKLLTHQTYNNGELVKTIDNCTRQHGKCPFYVMQGTINLTHELALYSGQTHASRFPVPWFLTPIINHAYSKNKTKQKNDRIKRYEDKYYALMIDDFEKYDPKLILVGNFENPFGEGKFNLKEYLEQNTSGKFDPIFKQYEFLKTIEIKQTDYFYQAYAGNDYMTYDIYTKTSDRNNKGRQNP